MGMELEMIVLGTLILVFIVSFCGLLQKIRKTYDDRHRQYTGRVTNLSSGQVSLTEIYINPTFHTENGNAESNNNQGIFPGAPPPYSETFHEPPPKYEDIVKNQAESTSSG